MQFSNGNLFIQTRPATLTLYSSWMEAEALHKPKFDTVILHDSNKIELCNNPLVRYIFLQGEPEVITHSRAFMLKSAHRFTWILTFDEYVLQACPNARKYVFGGCWIHAGDRQRTNPSEKEFRISTLVGSKNEGEGHKFRRAIYDKQEHITSIPYTFYRSLRDKTPLPEITNNPIFQHDSKFELFRTFQYSLVIENSKQKDYFTEKIIDCLITKTIPIYWGCPNIHEYFDTSGFILLETPTFEEFNQKIQILTPDYYEKHKVVVEANYQRCLAYVSVEANINRTLKSIPEY